MKIFSPRTLTPWGVALISMLILTGCGSDSNPISPSTAQVNQLSNVNSQVPQNVFSSTLTGAAETPSVTSNGTGTGVVSVDPATNQMRATIVTADINGTQAHIHFGAAGVAGPVVFSLVENEAGSGVWTTTATLTADQLSQITAGNYYFNVHTAAYPDGEIRGQILAQLPQSGTAINTINSSNGTSTTSSDASGSSSSGTTASSASRNSVSASATANRPIFYANVLAGSLVVPPNASTATAIGIAAYRSNSRNLTAVVVSRDVVGTGVNIRQAAASTTGAIVGSFTETSPGSNIWLLRATLTAPQAEALTNGGMYYELLSSAFPGGELRGQIVRTQGTTTPTTPVAPAAPSTTTTPVSATAPTTAAVTTTVPITVTPTTAITTPTTTTNPTTTIPATSTVLTPTITPTTTLITPTPTVAATTATTPTIVTTPTTTTNSQTTPASTPVAAATPPATDGIGVTDLSATTTTSRTTSTTVSTTTPTSTLNTVTPVTSPVSTQITPSSIASQ